MVKIKNKISSDDKAKLFYLNLNNKKDTDLFHTGSIKNLKASGILINKLEQNTEIIISYNSIGYKNVFNINKQKIMLNRDILLYKLNGNKEKARIIHYLLVVYSNYEKEEFYNANYNENINYFLYLEKYYKK
ncbi:hypothetical protein [Mycoplasmopsis citelli]|nr:hypothetical protein [Mycoplasmopsis citelli]